MCAQRTSGEEEMDEPLLNRPTTIQESEEDDDKTEPRPQTTGTTLEDNKAAYKERFLELEFRALRASLMNYKESGRFDYWTRVIDYATLVIAVLGILVGTALLYSELYIKGAVTLGAALPTSGLMLTVTRWRSQLLPFATRAQSHVNAGAEWTRIRRLAKLYRSQLQTATPDLDKLESQYKELINAHKDASLFTVIRAKAYKEYNNVTLVFEEYKRRINQTKEYENLLSALDQKASPAGPETASIEIV